MPKKKQPHAHDLHTDLAALRDLPERVRAVLELIKPVEMLVEVIDKNDGDIEPQALKKAGEILKRYLQAAKEAIGEEPTS